MLLAEQPDILCICKLVVAAGCIVEAVLVGGGHRPPLLVAAWADGQRWVGIWALQQLLWPALRCAQAWQGGAAALWMPPTHPTRSREVGVEASHMQHAVDDFGGAPQVQLPVHGVGPPMGVGWGAG